MNYKLIKISREWWDDKRFEEFVKHHTEVINDYGIDRVVFVPSDYFVVSNHLSRKKHDVVATSLYEHIKFMRDEGRLGIPEVEIRGIEAHPRIKEIFIGFNYVIAIARDSFILCDYKEECEALKYYFLFNHLSQSTDSRYFYDEKEASKRCKKLNGEKEG